GVLGTLDGAAERRQAPGIEHQQDAGQGHAGEADRREDAHAPRAYRAARLAGWRGAFRGLGDGGGGRGLGRLGHRVEAPLVVSGEGACRVAYLTQLPRMRIQIMVATAMAPISMKTSL